MTEQNLDCELSPTQLDIYIDQVIDQDIPLYNIGGYVVLKECIDSEAFARAHQEEIAQHDAFLLRFAMVDGQPRQRTQSALPVLEAHDFSMSDTPASAARDWLQSVFERNFALADAPLLVSALVKLADNEYWYCAVAHHLIIDGWGFSLWVKKLVARYLAETGRGPVPRAPAMSFLDSVAESVRRSREDTHLRTTALPAWPAPLLEPRTAADGPHRSLRVVRDVDTARVAQLAGFAAAHGFELHHFLLAALYAYFASLKRRGSWAVGLPLHNRRGLEKSVIGSYVSVAPCLLEADQADGIVALMVMVRRAMKQSLRHQHRSLTELVRTGRTDAGQTRRLFDIQFNYLKLDYQTDGEQLQTATHYLANCWSQTPFSLNVCEFGSHQPIQLQIDVNEAYYTRQEAELILDRLDFVCDQLIADPSMSHRTVDIVPPAEKQMLARYGRAPDSQHYDLDIAGRFAQVCARSPAAIALRSGAVFMTYAELYRRARSLAAWLQANTTDLGAPLAICMKSSPDAYVALLAAALLRRPSVQIDPAYPSQRLATIVTDAGAELVLTDDAGQLALQALGYRLLNLSDADTAGRLAGVDVDRLPGTLAVPDRALDQTPAWIIYTSGSTGKPKGVVVPQSAILRLALPNFMVMDASTVTFQSCNVAFDVATFEIWGTLLNGGTLVLQPPQAFDLDMLTNIIEEHRVNTLWLTAGLFDKWIARLKRLPASLKYVMAGGDVVPPTAVHKLQQLQPGITFINGYGPTENGVFSTCAVVTAPCDPRSSIPIGKPVNGSSAYVVDAEGQLLPFGEAGELWVGGDGLALGYLNQPELTQEKFPVLQGKDIQERIYKTGDRVRWRADGQLEYLGRIDQQVKIRGFRIEIEEIENCLRQHPDVVAAAVVAAGASASDKILRAFVCTRSADASALIPQLLSRLRSSLPEYMVPAQISLIDSLPVNANGKIDRNVLRQMALPAVAQGESETAATATEATVWRIWQGVLSAAPVSRNGNLFAYGGHSLAAMQIAAEINEQFGTRVTVSDVLKRPTIRQQAELVDELVATRPVHMAGITRTAPPDDIPMSFVQQQMWLSHQLNGGSHEYNVPGAFQLRGRLDCTALEAALRGLVARHQPLRCLVVERDGKAFLRAADPAQFRLGLRELASWPDAERAAALSQAIRAERERSFDLERELPLRAEVLTLGEDEHVLLLTFHHIAVDGWSLANLQSELAVLYQAYVRAAPPALPPLPLEYHDFAAHQHAQAGSEEFRASERYWRGHLEGAPAVHELPLDRPRGEAPGYRGRVHRAVLAPEAAAAVSQLAAAEGFSLFTVLKTMLALVVGEYSGQRDVVIGTPVSGRHDRALYPLVGCFINTLATRTRYSGQDSVRAVLGECDRQWRDNLAHHELPFARVLAAVAPSQSRSFHPLFQLWFVLHAQEPGVLALDGLQVTLLRDEQANTKFDLMVSAVEGAEGITIEWLYREDLFDDASMARMCDAYLAVLRSLPASLDVPAGGLAGKMGLAAGALHTPMRRSYDRATSVADRVFQHAAATPDSAAVCDGTRSLSYAELVQQVGRLRALLAESGVGPGDCVGVCADRTIGGIVALLAVQALGAAYLPLDAKLPKARLEFMLADGGAEVLLCYQDILEHLPGAAVDVVLLDGVGAPDWLADYADTALPAAPVNPDSPAYLIYTSGSSGVPKGVRVSRSNLAHYVNAMDERHDFSGCRRYAVNSAFHTDLGNTTLYLGLWLGGCLHLMGPDLMLDGAAVSRYMREHAIDVMKITPGHFSALCDDELYEAPVPARVLVFGGEVLRAELLRAIAPVCLRRGCRVVNHYGPTEATIGCLTREIDLQAIPPIASLGLPLPGESARIEANGTAVPVGAWGELLVGGPAVSLGYHRRDDLTAAAFTLVPDERGVPVRWYRTGDRVRLNAAGEVEFGGRIDDQIKLRGFRIELAEIDSSLLRLPGVSRAVSIVYKDEAQQDALASFVVAADFDEGQALAALRGTLPEYMLPSVLVALEQIPLLGNGKPDRRALATLAAGRRRAPYQAPETPSERTIADIVGKLLNLDKVSVDQRFFDMGGNSLLVTRLANELSLRMAVRIPINLLMANHSVRSLADLVDALGMATSPQVGGENMVEIDI